MSNKQSIMAQYNEGAMERGLKPFEVFEYYDKHEDMVSYHLTRGYTYYVFGWMNYCDYEDIEQGVLAEQLLRLTASDLQSEDDERDQDTLSCVVEFFQDLGKMYVTQHVEEGQRCRPLFREEELIR